MGEGKEEKEEDNRKKWKEREGSKEEEDAVPRLLRARLFSYLFSLFWGVTSLLSLFSKDFTIASVAALTSDFIFDEN